MLKGTPRWQWEVDHFRPLEGADEIMVSNSYYGSPQQVVLLVNVPAAEEILEELKGFALNPPGH